MESENKCNINEMLDIGELFDNVIDVVADVCNVTREGIICDKRMPYPTCRGICWHAIRVMTNATHATLAALVEQRGHSYTRAAIGTATTKAMHLILTNKHWESRWNEIRKRLGIAKTEKKIDEPLEVKIILPKGASKKLNIKVIEK